MANGAKKRRSNARESAEPAAQWVGVGELIEWADNPRDNDSAVRKVAQSIERFGFAAPIVARTGGEIIAGHTRFKAAQLLGLERVPVRYIDLDATEAHLLALADNKLGEEADWDLPKLTAVMESYSLPDIELAGWGSKELERLADKVPGFGPVDGGGDDSEKLKRGYSIVVECEDETQQRELLERFAQEGVKCRAWI